TVKYMLRNNEVDEAEKIFLLFIREDISHKIQEIVDIQATWYMCERGHAYRRLGDVGRALRQFHQAIDVFAAYHHDQLDFHAYSVRKATLRTYVDILEWETTILTHPFYGDAARSAIECYIELHDCKQAGSPLRAIPDVKDTKPLTRNGTAQHGQHHLSAGLEEVKVASVDVDPSGATLVDADDHLARALELVERLEAAVGSQAETHVLAFEVHLRMRKYFLVLKAINALKTIDADHPALAPMAVRLGKALDADEAFAAPMKAALKGQLAKSFGDVSIEASVASHPASFDHALAAAKGLLALGDTNAARAILLQAASEAHGRTVTGLLAASQLLEKSGATAEERDMLAASAKKAFPLAACF
ncbi:hypothetical protein H4R19_005600, partial [Coemansia spiralis]